MATSFTWTDPGTTNPAAPVPAEPTFGTDFSTFVGGVMDLDPNFALIGGPRVVAEAVARRLMTPRGGLLGTPNYGIDLRAFLNAAMTPDTIASVKAAVQAEATEDERVLSASADVTFTESTQSLRVAVQGLTAVGPFSLVLAVSSLTVSLLTGAQ